MNNAIHLLRAAMQAAYIEWGKDPTAEAYVRYVELRNRLLQALME